MKALLAYSSAPVEGCLSIPHSPVGIWRYGHGLEDSKLALLKHLSLVPLLTILLTAKWINWWGVVAMDHGCSRISRRSYAFICIPPLSEPTQDPPEINHHCLAGSLHRSPRFEGIQWWGLEWASICRLAS